VSMWDLVRETDNKFVNTIHIPHTNSTPFFEVKLEANAPCMIRQNCTPSTDLMLINI